MGFAQIPQQMVQTIVAGGDSAVTGDQVFLGLLITLILGAYVFTWLTSRENKKDRRDIWSALNKIKDNDLRHLEAEIAELKGHDVIARLRRLEDK